MASPRRAPARTALSQPVRLAIAIAYALLLLLLGVYLNGRFLPPFGLPGLWFYSAFGVLILGEFVIEPFFTRLSRASRIPRWWPDNSPGLMARLGAFLWC